MSNAPDKVGITAIPIEGQDLTPVFQDDSGLPTEPKDAPYLLSDDRSLLAPIPVIVSSSPVWFKADGSPVDALRVTHLPSGDGPTPAPSDYETNLLDFWTNEKDLTEYTTRFNSHGPNVVLEMCFIFTGEPVFQFMHGSDSVEVIAMRLDQDTGMGCLVAVGEGVVTEIAPLTVSCTGGTFGGVFGRVRELAYSPELVWSTSLTGRDLNYHDYDTDGFGETIGVSMWERGYSDSGQFTGINRQARAWIIDGSPITYTTSEVQSPWVEVDPGVYQLETENRPHMSPLFEFTFESPVPAPLYWDFAATANPGGMTFSGMTTETQVNNWTSGVVIGANITQAQNYYGQQFTGAKISGYGSCLVGSFRFYSDPTPYGCSIHRGPSANLLRYRNTSRNQWVALIACIAEKGSFRPFTMTVGDSGEWVGYSSGDIASPPFNPPVGEISVQPLVTHRLSAIYPSEDGLKVVFFG